MFATSGFLCTKCGALITLKDNVNAYSKDLRDHQTQIWKQKSSPLGKFVW